MRTGALRRLASGLYQWLCVAGAWSDSGIVMSATIAACLLGYEIARRIAIFKPRFGRSLSAPGSHRRRREPRNRCGDPPLAEKC
jgi:hypothetical protein